MTALSGLQFCSPGKRSAAGDIPGCGVTALSGLRFCSPGKRSAGEIPGCGVTALSRLQFCSPGKRSAVGDIPGCGVTALSGLRFCSPGKRSAGDIPGCGVTALSRLQFCSPGKRSAAGFSYQASFACAQAIPLAYSGGSRGTSASSVALRRPVSLSFRLRCPTLRPGRTSLSYQCRCTSGSFSQS